MLKWSIVFAPLLYASAMAGTLPQQTNNVHYGPYASETLDISFPVGVPPATGWPAIVFIHGGGWTEGSKDAYAGRSPVCSTMTVGCAASLGFVGVAIDYRLISAADATTWWPAQLLDAQLAVRWLRHNAANLNVDPGRICATGDSAGSSLAVQVGALSTTVQGWDVSALYPEVSPQAECVVDNFGPMTWGPLTVQKAPPGYSVPSPIPIASVPATGMVSTMVVQGTTDKVVVPQNGVALFNKLTAMNLATPYYSYPGGHEFTEADGKSSMSAAQRIPILTVEYAFIRSAVTNASTLSAAEIAH